MTELDPQPGELWWTDAGTLVWCEDGWHWTGGRRCENQDWIGRRLVGYTVEYVEKLRAERDAAVAARDNAQEYGETVERRKDAQDLMWRKRVRNLQAQRDEAEAEVEKLRAANTGDGEALAQLVRDVRDAPDPGHTVEIDGVLIGKKSRWLGDPDRKPWEVLREAAKVDHSSVGYVLTAYGARSMATVLNQEADRLEREAAEKSKRDRLIEVGRKAGKNADWSFEADGAAIVDIAAAVVDAVLAEAVTE